MNSGSPSTPTSVFHIDDDVLWIEIVANTLAACPDLVRVGAATNGREGIDECVRLRADVLLLEVDLPDIDGFTVAGELRQRGCRARLLLLTSRADDATLFHLQNPCIAGMVRKAPRIGEEVQRALALVARGQRYFDPSVTHALRFFRGASDAFFKILSDRELSLIPLLGEGCSDEEVAEQIGIAPSTVQSHRHHIMRKLNLSRKSDLVRWALSKGFVGKPRRMGLLR